VETSKSKKNHDRCLIQPENNNMRKNLQHIDYPPMPFDLKYTHTLRSNN